MNLLDTFLQPNNLGDTLLVISIFAIIVTLLYLVLGFIKRKLRKLSQHINTRLNYVLIETITATQMILLLPVALYIAVQPIDISPRIEHRILIVVGIGLILQAALWINRLINSWLSFTLNARSSDDPASITAMNLIGFVARTAMWAIAVLLILDYLGFNITTLLAGLGIGGVAVALGLQNILGDLFASLSIVLDRPFVVGDFIIIGDQMGTVEYVGLKTTRVRSLSGEQIILANSDLLKSRIHNYKRMQERRVLFRFGVVYQTEPTVLEGIPALVKEIITKVSHTRFDRAHFCGFGDSSLDFEVVYFVLNNDYNNYMDIHQTILFALFRALTTSKIDIAYPTRTVFINNTNTL